MNMWKDAVKRKEGAKVVLPPYAEIKRFVKQLMIFDE